MALDEITQQYIKNLTDNFIAGIIEKAEKDAGIAINQKLSNLDISGLIEQQITNTIVPFFDEQLRTKLESEAQERFSQIDVAALLNEFIVRVLIPRLEQQAKDTVLAQITQKLDSFNVADFARKEAAGTIKEILKTLSFPDHSIPGSSINPDNLQISASNIIPGIIKKFESTGIQDSASRCQVTILDQATVFENKLVAKDLEVAGDTTFKGNVSIYGTLPKDSAFVGQIVDLVVDSFNNQYDMIEEYATLVQQKLSEEGMDVAVVKYNGTPLIDGSTLNEKLVDSNLQSVGALKELQVIGETLLDQTLYVSGNRVGINTMEPERTLDLWDQEVQIIAGKRQMDTAVIGTIRNQALILSSNNKDQLTLNTDGTVTVKTLNIGRTTHSSSGTRPTDNRPTGHIVWNENPLIGSPVGWISLGGARWAPFGTISV